MLVYGHRSVGLSLAPFLATFLARLESLPHTPAHDAIVDLLVDFGEAESAFADWLCPATDDEHEELIAWRAAGHELASALCASWRGDAETLSAAGDRCRRLVAGLRDLTPSVDVRARTAEGFSCYALYPEQYMLAAQRVYSDRSGGSLVCIGLRSIGSTLAHVVAAAAERQGMHTEVRTLRPRGHPFDREIALGDGLRRLIREWSERCDFAIVDEGPGLSGSSFAAASDALIREGIPAGRITLFPAWNPAAHVLKSPRAQAAWQRHSKAVAGFESVSAATGEPAPSNRIIDYSAGAWRADVLGGKRETWPPVQPQHERRKYLARSVRSPVIRRFAGLGRYGRTKLARARALADAGFGPAPLSLEHGFLSTEWIDGVPLTSASGTAIDRVAAYLAFLKRSFGTGEREDVADMGSMIATNVAAAIGPACARRLTDLGGDWDEERIAVDGRMLPYEWIASGSRLLKVDALDHHADDFWPGCRDIAWDVAGAIVEFGLDPSCAETLVSRYREAARDRTITDRLPFYTAGYLAYRLGYVSLAAETIGSGPDADGFRRRQAYYRHSLEALAAHPVRMRRC